MKLGKAVLKTLKPELSKLSVQDVRFDLYLVSSKGRSKFWGFLFYFDRNLLRWVWGAASHARTSDGLVGAWLAVPMAW